MLIINIYNIIILLYIIIGFWWSHTNVWICESVNLTTYFTILKMLILLIICTLRRTSHFHISLLLMWIYVNLSWNRWLFPKKVDTFTCPLPGQTVCTTFASRTSPYHNSISCATLAPLGYSHAYCIIAELHIFFSRSNPLYNIIILYYYNDYLFEVVEATLLCNFAILQSSHEFNPFDPLNPLNP